MNSKLLVKYCGNRSREDYLLALSSRADYLGFVFAESKRKVTAKALREWIAPAFPTQKELVGVFVNASPEEIKCVAEEIPLSIIQCHGSETPLEIKKITDAASLPVWKAIHHTGKGSLEKMREYGGAASGFIIDSRAKGLWGGTGKTFDWSYVGEYLKESRFQGVPCFIAGGINPGNIDELLALGPDGIDLASGIEKDGYKCESLIVQLEERISEYETSRRN